MFDLTIYYLTRYDVQKEHCESAASERIARNRIKKIVGLGLWIEATETLLKHVPPHRILGIDVKKRAESE